MKKRNADNTISFLKRDKFNMDFLILANKKFSFYVGNFGLTQYAFLLHFCDKNGT